MSERMPMDFHAKANQRSYATREVHPSWLKAVTQIVSAEGKRVYDIGCGGGIYAREWARLGAAQVVGVDFSAAMLEEAARTCAGLPNVRFHQGDALATGLPSASADLVYERALIHHVRDLTACVAEAYRLLDAGGVYLTQDRTPEDQREPGRPDYIRGYFNECFPRLLEIELRRRPNDAAVRAGLAAAGFQEIQRRGVLEVRRVYASVEELAPDLRARTERSILHELSDDELERLVAFIQARVPAGAPITDASQWTLWWGRK
jgi:ubiquinone/menaquinone biosynthesis C-methylase UbiE